MDQTLQKALVCSSLEGGFLLVPQLPALSSWILRPGLWSFLSWGQSLLSAYKPLAWIAPLWGQCWGHGHLFDSILHRHDLSLMDRSPAGPWGSFYYLLRVHQPLYSQNERAMLLLVLILGPLGQSHFVIHKARVKGLWLQLEFQPSQSGLGLLVFVADGGLFVCLFLSLALYKVCMGPLCLWAWASVILGEYERRHSQENQNPFL